MQAKSAAIHHKLETKDTSRAITMEREAIEQYEKLIRESKGEERKIYEEILADENDHLIKVEKIRNKEI